MRGKKKAARRVISAVEKGKLPAEAKQQTRRTCYAVVFGAANALIASVGCGCAVSVFPSPPFPLALKTVKPRREGGGCIEDRLLDCILVPILAGRLGGKPGSPTGPVIPVRLLCLSLALAKSSPNSDVASVAAEAEETGLPV